MRSAEAEGRAAADREKQQAEARLEQAEREWERQKNDLQRALNEQKVTLENDAAEERAAQQAEIDRLKEALADCDEALRAAHVGRSTGGQLLTIDYSLIEEIPKELGLTVSKAQLDELFDSWDPDKSGVLTIDELQKLLRRGTTVELDATLQPPQPACAWPGA